VKLSLLVEGTIAEHLHGLVDLAHDHPRGQRPDRLATRRVRVADQDHVRPLLERRQIARLEHALRSVAVAVRVPLADRLLRGRERRLRRREREGRLADDGEHPRRAARLPEERRDRERAGGDDFHRALTVSPLL
jgi:hypothetical protein